jgi:hypothetical protein
LTEDALLPKETRRLQDVLTGIWKYLTTQLDNGPRKSDGPLEYSTVNSKVWNEQSNTVLFCT